MSGIHEEWAKGLALGFNGPKNQALYGALGAAIGDRTLADAQGMVTESLPSYASPTANGLTANDRVLVKGPSESDESFAARLVAYGDQWRLASTPVGLLIQLYYAGFTGAVMVQQNGLSHTLNSAPNLDELAVFVSDWQAQRPSAFPAWYEQTELANGNPAIPASTDGKADVPAMTVPWWTFDAGMDAEGNQFCGRFGILFPATAPSPSLGTASNLSRIRRIIADWKPGARSCAGIWVASSGAMWGFPGLVWGGFNWGGSVTFYSAE